MPLDNFAFVLFSPQSPGNIGAVARALKNMGCRDLRIVRPADSPIAGYSERRRARLGSGVDNAKTMAVHGSDVLAAATIHAELSTALADCTIVVGTTARTGPYRSQARPKSRSVAGMAGSFEQSQ